MSKQVRRYVAMVALGAVLATAFVLLGRWQLDRLEERRAGNDTIVAHRELPVVPYQERMNDVITDADQWYRVTATGTYGPQQFQLRYRSLNGAYGSEIFGVLQTEHGNVLVDRGFLPRQPGFPDGAMPDAPDGEVTVTGYVRRNMRGDDNSKTPHEGQLRTIDSDFVGRSLGIDIANGYIQLIESDPPETSELTPLGEPQLTEGNHLSYALQWFAFTVIGVIGMGVLIRSDIRDRKKAAAKKEAAARKAAAAKQADAAGPDENRSAEEPSTDEARV